MKYKVGDRVKVRDDLEVGKCYGNCEFTEDMTCTNKVTIEDVYIEHESYDVKENYYGYTDEMLDGLVSEQDDAVNNPKHYTYGKYECIDVMRELFGDEAVKAFCKCNIFKYTYRAEHKNGDEDRKKAEWYTEYLMKMNKSKEN